MRNRKKQLTKLEVEYLLQKMDPVFNGMAARRGKAEYDRLMAEAEDVIREQWESAAASSSSDSAD